MITYFQNILGMKSLFTDFQFIIYPSSLHPILDIKWVIETYSHANAFVVHTIILD